MKFPRNLFGPIACLLILVLSFFLFTRDYTWAQEPTNELAVRMHHLRQAVSMREKFVLEKIHCPTLFTDLKRFADTWVDANALDSSQRRLFDDFRRAIQAEIDSVPMPLFGREQVEFDAAFDTALAQQTSKDDTLGNSRDEASQRSKLVVDRKALLRREEFYDRLRRELFEPTYREYRVDLQKEWAVGEVRRLISIDPIAQRFVSDYLIHELAVLGSNALFQNAVFQDQIGWSQARCDEIVFDFDFEAVELQTISSIKRKALSEFLEILTAEQRDMLARKLGIRFDAIPQLADITPASDLKNVFSEMVGEVTINHECRSRLIASCKSAMASVRQFIESDAADCAGAIDAIATIKRDLNSFPPGEFGDLTDVVGEFVGECDQLKSERCKTLKPVLMDIIDEFNKYTLDSATPWKWPGVTKLHIHSSLGELADDELEADVSFKLKSMFSSSSKLRKLAADPTEQIGWFIVGSINDNDLNLPSNQVVEIYNKMNDVPKMHTYSDAFERSKDIGAQVAIVTDRLIPRQSARMSAKYARFLFARYGPHNYFQRPDFAAEFEITPQQKRRMDEFARSISERIESEVHPRVQAAIGQLLNRLSAIERQKAAEILDCRWDEIPEALLQQNGERRVREMLIDPFGPNYTTRCFDYRGFFRFNPVYRNEK